MKVFFAGKCVSKAPLLKCLNYSASSTWPSCFPIPLKVTTGASSSWEYLVWFMDLMSTHLSSPGTTHLTSPSRLPALVRTSFNHQFLVLTEPRTSLYFHILCLNKKCMYICELKTSSWPDELPPFTPGEDRTGMAATETQINAVAKVTNTVVMRA